MYTSAIPLLNGKTHSGVTLHYFREYQLPVVFGKIVIASHITNQRSTAKPGNILNSNASGCIIATIDYILSFKIMVTVDCLNSFPP